MKLFSFIKASLFCFFSISLFSVHVSAQYCTPAPSFGCLTGDYPTEFTMTGTSMSINDPSLTCSGGGYSDVTAAETCAVASPSTVNCTIASNIASTYSSYTTFTASGASSVHGPTTESCQLWVDWDNSGVFGDAAGEVIGGMAPLPTSPVAFTVSIPSGIATGYYRMRLVLSSGATYPSMDPCMQLFPGFSYFSGDAIDYTIYVGPTCTAPAPTLGSATCTSQTINWGAVTGATGYEYVINTSSTAPTGAGTATTATTYNATGLTTGTTYYAWVRTNCGGGSYSSWVDVPFTVGPAAITGTPATCPGGTTHLSDVTAGGTWTSSSGNATVSGTGLVTGVTTGTAIISYSLGGCSSVITVTVAPLPAITGVTNVCPGSTTTLSDAVPGGVWSSGTGSVATVSGTGIVYGTTNGNTTITYTANGCSTTTTVTVSALPAITGNTGPICAGLTVALSDAVSGGVWSSANTTAATVSSTGVVTGVISGSATIIYTLSGCSVSTTVTVANAINPITGNPVFCMTSTTTLSDATPGGTWSSGNVTIATVAGPVVHGVSGGAAVISYSAGGCSVTTTVNVAPNNGGTITGKDSVCAGAGHVITLSDSQTGGVWSSTPTTYATIDPSTGVVTGVTPGGTVTIHYVVTNACGTYTVSYVVHVRTAAQCATGINQVAVSDQSKLSVYPNPNAGIFTMNLSSDIDEEVHVVVTNLVGEKVKEFTTKTNNTVDVKLNTAAGVYLLSASTDHGKYIAKVVVEK